jgi:hypothetical protein
MCGRNAKCEMSLQRRRELGVDPDMQLLCTDDEPNAAACAQQLRLLKLRQPQQFSEEPTRLDLASGWRSELNVINAEHRHGLEASADSGGTSWRLVPRRSPPPSVLLVLDLIVGGAGLGLFAVSICTNTGWVMLSVSTAMVLASLILAGFIQSRREL